MTSNHVAGEKSRNPRKTQGERILARLVEARGAEVSSYELAQIALQYAARISEQRAQGHRIISRTERRGGQVFGYFRLETGPRNVPKPPDPQSKTEPPQQRLLELEPRWEDLG